MTTSHIRAEAVTEAILSMFRTGAAGLRFTPAQGQQLANAILSRATLQDPEPESQASPSDIEHVRTATINGKKLVITEGERACQHLNDLGIPAIAVPGHTLFTSLDELFEAVQKAVNPVNLVNPVLAPSEDFDHICNTPAPELPELHAGLTFPADARLIRWLSDNALKAIDKLGGRHHEADWENRLNAFHNLRHLARYYGRTDEEVIASILTFSRARDKDMQCLHSRDLITAIITSLKAAHTAELPATSDTACA